MDSESVITWKRTLTCTISSGKQISRRGSLQRWLERCQAKQMKEKERKKKEIIIIQMVVADAEEAEEVAAEEVATIFSI
jgi:hypothetical protein